MNYKNMIGDGKLPNYYWVFQYDEKFKRNGDDVTELISDNENAEGGLLGKFKTFKEALRCKDREAYLPHVTIEDRITGQVYESMVITCPWCGKDEYETFNDIKYTKDFIEKEGFTFE